MLVSKKPCAPKANPRAPKVNPNQPNLNKPVEYSGRWVYEDYVGVCHVDSLLFVSFLFTFGTQRERGVCWNTGLNKMTNAHEMYLIIIPKW